MGSGGLGVNGHWPWIWDKVKQYKIWRQLVVTARYAVFCKYIWFMTCFNTIKKTLISKAVKVRFQRRRQQTSTTQKWPKNNFKRPVLIYWKPFNPKEIVQQYRAVVFNLFRSWILSCVSESWCDTVSRGSASRQWLGRRILSKIVVECSNLLGWSEAI